MFKWQALDLLIEALYDLFSEGIRFHLLAVGDGPYREEWEQLARERLKDRAHFVGRGHGKKSPDGLQKWMWDIVAIFLGSVVRPGHPR